MTYTTVADVKAYLGLKTAVDDALLASLVASAQKAIETHTRRVFESSADSIRYFSPGIDSQGARLLLDRDLCAITSIITNADGTSPVTLTTAQYFTLPRNNTPYWGIEIAQSSSQSWRYSSDVQAGIKITGKWAYSLTAPADIVQACLRLAGYYYRQKDAQVFDTTSIPEQGVMVIPQGIPKDVKLLLEPYVRWM